MIGRFPLERFLARERCELFKSKGFPSLGGRSILSVCVRYPIAFHFGLITSSTLDRSGPSGET